MLKKFAFMVSNRDPAPMPLFEAQRVQDEIKNVLILVSPRPQKFLARPMPIPKMLSGCHVGWSFYFKNECTAPIIPLWRKRVKKSQSVKTFFTSIEIKICLDCIFDVQWQHSNSQTSADCAENSNNNNDNNNNRATTEVIHMLQITFIIWIKRQSTISLLMNPSNGLRLAFVSEWSNWTTKKLQLDA